MPEMNLRLSRFTYSLCRRYTKNKKTPQKSGESGSGE